MAGTPCTGLSQRGALTRVLSVSREDLDVSDTVSVLDDLSLAGLGGWQSSGGEGHGGEDAEEDGGSHLQMVLGGGALSE